MTFPSEWRWYVAAFLSGVLLASLGFTVGAIVDSRRDAELISELRDRARRLEEDLTTTEGALRRARELNNDLTSRQREIVTAVEGAAERLAEASRNSRDIVELVEVAISLVDELSGVLRERNPATGETERGSAASD